MDREHNCGYCLIIVGGSIGICTLLYFIISAIVRLAGKIHVDLHGLSLAVFITCAAMATLLIVRQLVKRR